MASSKAFLDGAKSGSLDRSVQAAVVDASSLSRRCHLQELGLPAFPPFLRSVGCIQCGTVLAGLSYSLPMWFGGDHSIDR